MKPATAIKAAKPSVALDHSQLFDVSVTGPLTKKRCINLDNGASTQPTTAVMTAVGNFMKYYSSAHRGNGFKSQITTWAFEEARVGLLRFVQAREDQHLCIFTKNTTESVNLLAARFPFVKERNVILISSMEHHSSDLPWRKTGHTIVYIAINKDGTLDMDDLQNKVSMYGNSLALVCVSGASNVTGILNPIYKVARIAHSVGAQVYIDCAQLVSRRAIDVKDLDDPEHLDYIAFAGHKMYAPFGSAVLIGRKDAFSGGTPFLDGGGAVNIVTLVNVTYKEGAEKEEAGSPNTVGAYAMFIASKQLQQITFSAIENHERALMEYALPKLQKIPGLKLAGGYPVDLGTRGGVISFTIDNIHFNLVAAILGTDLISLRENFIRKDINNKIGYIRLSFGLGNTFTDVDLVVDALKKIVHGEYKFKYIQDEHGEFSAAGVNCDFSAFVSLDVEPLKHPTRMTLKTVFLEWKEKGKKWMKIHPKLR
ncbi:aminotransferase [Rhizoclosmatium globosum]|uniref:Aminotransferase n=1 Tax=Rhizoclosmatium globosum TaxID=329046 RepID=A0A1Y2CFU0_9FUNG|nr:aminotransferase [Rhizoclosmatium globosum]|eukprot:ORY45938.1 aminotransferase [Rhizoclosmatium globosum]